MEDPEKHQMSTGAMHIGEPHGEMPVCGPRGPAFQGLMTGRIPSDSQGELQGAVTSLTSLAALVAPLPLTTLFSRFAGPDATFYLPGALFYVASLLALLGLALTVRTLAAGRDVAAP